MGHPYTACGRNGGGHTVEVGAVWGWAPRAYAEWFMHRVGQYLNTFTK